MRSAFFVRAAAFVAVASLLPIGAAVSASADRGPAQPGHPAPTAATPNVTPVPGDTSVILANYPLSKVGYAASEFFFDGNASSYTNTAPLGSDGKWSAQPVMPPVAYKSRLVVVAPTNPRKFSGTVVVEWFNVSSGADGAPDWSFAHDKMIRDGDVYVGVSAQFAGVKAAKEANSDRYGTLVHPGDSYSYDMFSQAGQAIRMQSAKLLGGLRPRLVIAAGESQSAFRLTTYVNAIAPLVNVYDSYLINSRSGGSANLSDSPVIATPAVVYTRTDTSVPVLTFQTETDVVGILNYFPVSQEDSDNFRLWEVAGTSHADNYLVTQFVEDDTSWASDLLQFTSMSGPPSSVTLGGFSLACPVPFNAGQQHYVFQAALASLIDWTRTGRPPQSMPRLNVNTATTPPSYVLDSVGNVTGGIRNPAVDAPIAVLSGLPPAGAPGFCVLFGQTKPLTPSQLSALYPTHKSFVQQWRRSVRDARKNGSLLPEDADRLEDVVSP